MGAPMQLRKHADHACEKRRRCVYCRNCGVRLYAGGMPAEGKKGELVDALDGALEALRDHVGKKGR